MKQLGVHSEKEIWSPKLLGNTIITVTFIYMWFNFDQLRRGIFLKLTVFVFAANFSPGNTSPTKTWILFLNNIFDKGMTLEDLFHSQSKNTLKCLHRQLSFFSKVNEGISLHVATFITVILYCWLQVTFRSLRGQNLRDAKKNPSANVTLSILQNSGKENEIY